MKRHLMNLKNDLNKSVQKRIVLPTRLLNDRIHCR